VSQMHGNRLFTGIVHVKGRFVFHMSTMTEIEHPWRICDHALHVHFWPGKALVIGKWKPGLGETGNLLRAIRGRRVKEDEKPLRSFMEDSVLQEVTEPREEDEHA
jgi:hypothetical protein